MMRPSNHHSKGHRSHRQHSKGRESLQSHCSSKINENGIMGNQEHEKQYTATVDIQTRTGCHGKTTTPMISITSNERPHIQQVQHKSQIENHRDMPILWMDSTTQQQM